MQVVVTIIPDQANEANSRNRVKIKQLLRPVSSGEAIGRSVHKPMR